jgi:hypothetical protein
VGVNQVAPGLNKLVMLCHRSKSSVVDSRQVAGRYSGKEQPARGLGCRAATQAKHQTSTLVAAEKLRKNATLARSGDSHRDSRSR